MPGARADARAWARAGADARPGAGARAWARAGARAWARADGRAWARAGARAWARARAAFPVPGIRPVIESLAHPVDHWLIRSGGRAGAGASVSRMDGRP